MDSSERQALEKIRSTLEGVISTLSTLTQSSPSMAPLVATEFAGLRSEVLELSKLRIQVATLSLIVVGTVFGWISKVDHDRIKSSASFIANQFDVVSLIILSILTVLVIFSIALKRHLRRLSTYIKVAYENQGYCSWETDWQKFPNRNRTWSYSKPCALLYFVCGLIAICYPAVFKTKVLMLPIELSAMQWVTILIFIVFLFLTLHLYFEFGIKWLVGHDEKALEEIWRNVRGGERKDQGVSP